jgi:ATP-dependent protease ClpP protease subunit
MPEAPVTDIESLVRTPNVRLHGPIENATISDVLDDLSDVMKSEGAPVVLELTTEGGDADAARRIANEIRLCRKWFGRATYFVGKTIVYSAGISIMAAFPNTHRYLTEDTTLLIHERRLSKSVELKGPMKSNIQILREQLAEMETARRIEREGFAELATGSRISVDDLAKKAEENYYLTARESLELGLIAGVL